MQLMTQRLNCNFRKRGLRRQMININNIKQAACSHLSIKLYTSISPYRATYQDRWSATWSSEKWPVKPELDQSTIIDFLLP